MLTDYSDIRLIGLAGAAGAGKDTIATLMVVDDWEHVAFADPLKDICVRHLGLSKDDVYTQEGKMKFNDFWGMTNREILQKVGTEAMRNGFDKDVWVKIMELKLTGILMRGGKVIVTDCRFGNEAELIYRIGGVVAKVERPSMRSMLTKSESGHSSEGGIDDGLVSFTVVNDADIPRLKREFVGKKELFEHKHGDAARRICELCEKGCIGQDDATALILGMKHGIGAGAVAGVSPVAGGGVRVEFRRSGGIASNVVVLDGKASFNRFGTDGPARTEAFDLRSASEWRMIGSLL